MKKTHKFTVHEILINWLQFANRGEPYNYYECEKLITITVKYRFNKIGKFSISKTSKRSTHHC